MKIAKTWRQQSANLRLLGNRCSSCEAVVFPQRMLCSSCGGSHLESYQFSGQGEVIALTTVHEAPRGFGDQVPYIAGLVKLVEGPVLVAMITDVDPGDVTVGMQVGMVTRRIWTDGSDGPIVYGYKFSPLES